MAFLLLYVDDIVLTASSQSFLQQVILIDMGPLHHFLGITVECRDDGMFLSQRHYLLDILDRAGMRDCKPCSTPMDTHSKLSTADGTSVSDPTHYRSITGALQYLTFTHPDVAYVVPQVCLHMHDPRDLHLAVMKRILRYLQGSQDLGLHLYRTTPTDFIVYSDADWAGCPDTWKSTPVMLSFLDIISFLGPTSAS